MTEIFGEAYNCTAVRHIYYKLTFREFSSFLYYLFVEELSGRIKRDF
jgi:hypothetical protein